MQSVLVCGSSIAGPALGWWLRHRGFNPTLLEKAAAPRPGGHAVDVRGVALDVLRGMGAGELAQAQRTRMRGVSTIDADGKELWRSEQMTISGGSFNKDSIEILRDDLSNILVSRLPTDVELIYDDAVTSIKEDPEGCLVSFQNASPRHFDLVIGADGLGSSLRRQVFGPDSEYLKPFDVALAPFSIANTLGIEDWQLNYASGTDNCLIYTARDNRELRVCFGFKVPLADVPTTRAAQLALVRKHCSRMRWRIPEFLAAMDHAPDFYLGPMAQVHMARWTRGRMALVGDAGYCPSPYTGQGTSLALVGAYLLAFELASSPHDHRSAYARYDEKMRPFVLKNQAIAALTRDDRLSDPAYYTSVVEPAMDAAKNAIQLDGLGGR